MATKSRVSGATEDLYADQRRIKSPGCQQEMRKTHGERGERGTSYFI